MSSDLYTVTNGKMRVMLHPGQTKAWDSKKRQVFIIAGTQSGKVLRLRGKGLPNVQRYGTGDLFVHLHIYTPTNVSKEERELLEKLRDSENFDPYKAQKDKGFFSRMRDIFSS